MQGDAAWLLLGTIIRLAQFGDLRNRQPQLWRCVLWQDSLLNMCFDRPSAVSEQDYGSIKPSAESETYTYLECMQMTCYTAYLANSQLRRQHVSEIEQTVTNLEDFMQQASAHLRSVESCRSLQQRRDHLALELHRNFTLSILCRSVIGRKGRQVVIEQAVRDRLVQKLHAVLERSLRAFLQLRDISVYATRSWAAVHNSLSSAILLGLLQETRTLPGIQGLQRDLIDALSNDTESDATNGNLPLSDMHIRAVHVLDRLQQASAEGLMLPTISDNSYLSQRLVQDQDSARDQDSLSDTQVAAPADASLDDGTGQHFLLTPLRRSCGIRRILKTFLKDSTLAFEISSMHILPPFRALEPHGWE